eukprot:m.244997 g.244997  ORF g.244997 m.244997 type:complete len:72 (-) comp26389_c0_seq2:218-433(-)
MWRFITITPIARIQFVFVSKMSATFVQDENKSRRPRLTGQRRCGTSVRRQSRGPAAPSSEPREVRYRTLPS